jgi:crotonobetainyl-CoA:carnitine CoA-transferase CaiB-like acyl-CoA transferase
MTETVTSHHRIDQLKALAIKQGFTNENAKQFGKLSKTATWEALLETYGVPLHPVDTVDSKAESLDTSD